MVVPFCGFPKGFSECLLSLDLQECDICEAGIPTRPGGDQCGAEPVQIDPSGTAPVINNKKATDVDI